jgi:hypothetical protein
MGQITTYHVREGASGATGSDGKRVHSLIPGDIKDDLHRRVEKWSEHEHKRVADAVWKTAYADKFFAELREHIHRHFPELVIPQVVDRFKAEAGARVTEWVVQTANAELNSSAGQYEKECGRIGAARAELQKLCETSQRQLQEPFARIQAKLGDKGADTRALFDTIRETLNKLQGCPPFDRLPHASLEPLCHWHEEMVRKRNGAIDTIACILQGRDDAPEDVIESLPPLQVHSWHTAIRRLHAAGYTAEVARKGKRVETRDEGEKAELRELNTALNNLALVLSPLLQSAMVRAATHEQRSIVEAMRQLLDIHWKDVTERAQDRVRDLGLNLSFTPPAVNLEAEEKALTVAYQFTSELPIVVEVRNEPTGDVVVEVVADTFWKWLRKTIGIPVLVSTPVYEDRSYDLAEIPSAEALLERWTNHARQQEPILVRLFFDWMFGQLDHAAEALQRSQQELLDRYQAKLAEAHAIAERTHAQSQQVWSGILDQAQELHQCLERLCCPRVTDGRQAHGDA